MNDYSLTVLVNSCDKYSDAWLPFFTFFEKNGGRLKDYPIVLANESKEFSYPTLNLTAKHFSKNGTWSSQILEVLKQIESEFVLFLIDDYFLIRPLCEESFEKAVSFMKDNPNVGYLNVSTHKLGPEPRNNPVELDTDTCRICLGVTFWRKDYFISLLREHENIWDFERYSHLRAKSLGKKLMLFQNNLPVMFYYDIRRRKKTVRCLWATDTELSAENGLNPT